jgi:hypothetical protein
MSGQRITKYQAQVYMNVRETGETQAAAATIAGMSARSGQRIEAGEHQPNRGRVRDWCSRTDPLAAVWESELEPMLRQLLSDNYIVQATIT